MSKLAKSCVMAAAVAGLIALVLGIAVGIFTLVSGILPQITGWENDNEVHRTVFGGIPGPIQIAFYTVIPVMVIWGAFMFANRMKNWERGTPAQRHTTRKNAAQRLKDFRAVATTSTQGYPTLVPAGNAALPRVWAPFQRRRCR